MLSVRSACPEDAKRCAEIYAPFVDETWNSFESASPSTTEMRQRIATAQISYDWLVAEIDDHIAGYAYGSRHRSREAYQSSCDVTVYLDPVFLRQGIGRALYQALFASLKSKNMHSIFAGVALPNDASIGLHKSLGFESVGTFKEVGWKLGSWRDVHWLQRLL